MKTATAMESIIDIMKGEGVKSLDFICSRNRPTVWKDGDRYEIQSITLQEDDTVEITGIKTYPSYEYKLTYLTVDSTWRKTSINHIKNIIQQQIAEIYNY